MLSLWLCRLISVRDNGVPLVLAEQAECVLGMCSFPGKVVGIGNHSLEGAKDSQVLPGQGNLIFQQRLVH